MVTKSWNDIKRQRPTSSKARNVAHLDNLAEDLGMPLAELRRFVELTQVELAQRPLVTQPSVSEIERSESPAVPTVRRYVEALGAHLEQGARCGGGEGGKQWWQAVTIWSRLELRVRRE